jgi:RimJ/RimL family protein N-acetyltransferase
MPPASVARDMSIPPTVARVRAAPGLLTEVILRDGTAALIWPLLGTDGAMLRHGYSELSSESRQQRFLGSVPELSNVMLRSLIDGVDGVNHLALLLTVLPEDGQARPVGVARLVRYPEDPSSADVAVTVSDAWHGRGVASVLMAALLARRPADVTRLRTMVAADNRASLAMLSRLGTMTTHLDGSGVLTVEISDLTPPA